MGFLSPPSISMESFLPLLSVTKMELIVSAAATPMLLSSNARAFWKFLKRVISVFLMAVVLCWVRLGIIIEMVEILPSQMIAVHLHLLLFRSKWQCHSNFRHDECFLDMSSSV